MAIEGRAEQHERVPTCNVAIAAGSGSHTTVCKKRLRALLPRIATWSHHKPSCLCCITTDLFNTRLFKRDAGAVKAAWQRYYFKGEYPEDVAPARDDHVNKRRLKEPRVGR